MPDQQTAPAESQWVQRIAQGDQEAFATLYDLYAKPLYSFAFRILGDHKEAEDVLQEVFLQIWEKAAHYDAAIAKPFTWAVTMTRNRSIDRLRARRRRNRLVEELPDLELFDEVAAVAVPAEEYFGRDQAVKIRTAVKELPDEQRRAIEMAFFGGLTHFEIAEQLREPLGTIKARIRRGMLRLRDCLEACV